MNVRIRYVYWIELFILTLLLIICSNNSSYAKNYTRSCTAYYYAIPTSIPGGGNRVILPEFTGKGTVGYYNPNEARRRARKNLEQCIRAHWDSRHGSNIPIACTEANQVYNYTISMLEAYLGNRLCVSNRGNEHITARVGANFRGDKGCEGGKRGLDTMGIELDSNLRFTCPTNDEPLH